MQIGLRVGNRSPRLVLRSKPDRPEPQVSDRMEETSKNITHADKASGSQDPILPHLPDPKYESQIRLQIAGLRQKIAVDDEKLSVSMSELQFGHFSKVLDYIREESASTSVQGQGQLAHHKQQAANVLAHAMVWLIHAVYRQTTTVKHCIGVIALRHWQKRPIWADVQVTTCPLHKNRLPTLDFFYSNQDIYGEPSEDLCHDLIDELDTQKAILGQFELMALNQKELHQELLMGFDEFIQVAALLDCFRQDHQLEAHEKLNQMLCRLSSTYLHLLIWHKEQQDRRRSFLDVSQAPQSQIVLDLNHLLEQSHHVCTSYLKYLGINLANVLYSMLEITRAQGKLAETGMKRIYPLLQPHNVSIERLLSTQELLQRSLDLSMGSCPRSD